MIRLTIDDREIVAESKMTILEAASIAGIDIPAMCHNSDAGHFASCMVCLVRERDGTSFIPSCSVRVREGMDIITCGSDIGEARRTALELLLSEHTGDCEAPCRIACPANMDIPLMNSFLAGGMPDRALEVVMRDIAMPSVLGRICPAPCEGACHRRNIDSPVSVCTLKRYAGDTGQIPVTPAAGTGKKVVIIGGGIAGLSAAFYLQLAGFSCTIYDNNPEPGGALRDAINDGRLDRETLDRETGIILKTGVGFISAPSVNKGSLSLPFPVRQLLLPQETFRMKLPAGVSFMMASSSSQTKIPSRPASRTYLPPAT
jgi:hypothetical protein